MVRLCMCQLGWRRLEAEKDRMSTESNLYPAFPRPAGEERTAEPLDPQAQIETEELTSAAQIVVRPSLVDAWVKALHAAESLHLRLNPAYLRHTEIELVSVVEVAL